MASTGPVIAGAAVNNSAYGSQAWSNPGNAIADDGNDSIASRSSELSTVDSYYLEATSFGFSIPSNATILGVTVTMNKWATSTFNVGAKDSIVKLVKGGSVVGDNKARPAEAWPSTNDVEVTYGGTSDMWGITLTPAEANASDFGMVLSVTLAPTEMSSSSGRVDAIYITIEYTVPGRTLAAARTVSTSRTLATSRTAISSRSSI